MFWKLSYLLLLTVAFEAHLSLASQWPYLQIYPPVNETDGRMPLYFAVVLSFGGAYRSIGALPGVQIALDYINSEPSILPGYSLHYTLADSQCERSTAVSSFFAQMTNPPTKVGWVGSGCTPATEPTAELTQHYNITQVSCVSSSPILHNRERFRYYFQLLSPEHSVYHGYYTIIKHFGWRRVGILTQDAFVGGVDVLKILLGNDDQVQYTEWYFRSEEGINNINPFDSNIRIFLVAMYVDHAKELFCEAFRRGLVPPKYMFLTPGWYAERWWQGGAVTRNYNCIGESLARVALYNVAAVLDEFPDNPDARADPNITLSEFTSLYNDAVASEINLNMGFKNVSNEIFQYSYHCHEATLTFAYALNQTISDLVENGTLNGEAAKLSGLPEGENFTMANFTYSNLAVVSRMFEHLQNTMFHGISGNDVRFNDQGTRIINRVTITQYQRHPNGSNGDLLRPEIGVVLLSGRNATFHPSPSSFYFPEGIPNDGVPIEEVVTVSVALTVVYVILATAGLVFAAVCFLFTLIFRNTRLIRLSSPNLNYIIGLGAIILYLNVITLVIPTTDPDFAAVLCNIHPWLISLGYSLCYGTILIKMIRVWVIFNNPLDLKAPLFRDYLMALFVLCLAIIDIVILLLYTVTEAVRENLGVKLTSNRELPEQSFGASVEEHRYFLYVCKSEGQVILYAILFGYKGLLQALALLLAFRTRNVKVKGLDDSVYIAASVYVTSIVLTVIIVSTYTLRDYVNAYPAVVGMGLLLGTTMILGLVFIPRMVGLYKDPNGETVNTFATSGQKEEGENTIDSGSDKQNELKKLRHRVIELEAKLKHSSGVVISGAEQHCEINLSGTEQHREINKENPLGEEVNGNNNGNSTAT